MTVPETRKQLQCFLGFANFYRCLIMDSSRIASPLLQFTSTTRTFKWTPDADSAFDKLKRLFSYTPILCHSDPKCKFILEVDASDTGVGAVLSQRSPSDNKVHPCAFFSQCLSRAEKSYDMSNRELLAVKLALEKWCHWLEGTETPFSIWTDHTKLTYLRDAKRLTPRKAHWSLIFNCFNYILTFRLGSKNVKPDALSCLPLMFQTKKRPSFPGLHH